MDFMNLNQSAHGDREFGFIGSRMRLERKVVVGHWQDDDVQASLGAWARAASAWHDAQGARFARFGDNMREVAVTEGDKVSAQMRLGYSVNGYGVGDLVRYTNEVSDSDIDGLIEEYGDQYAVVSALRPGGDRHQSLRDGARIEIGIRRFLENGNFKGFTTTFEDLHGLAQLPGLGPQRLMAEGYGFAGEGDWKTAALVRAMKVMACQAGHPLWRIIPITSTRAATRFLGRICWRSAHRSPQPSQRSKFIRLESAAKPTPCGWCSIQKPGRR
jgi:L-arabinose isomerase